MPKTNKMILSKQIKRRKIGMMISFTIMKSECLCVIKILLVKLQDNMLRNK